MATLQEAAASAEARAPAGWSAEIEASLRLFVASSRNMRNRLVHAGALLAGSAVLLPGLTAYLWFSAAAAVTLAASLIARRAADATDDAARRAVARALFLVTLLSSCVYGGWFAALWRTGDDAAQLFGLVMVLVSLTYILMQYYASPRVFVGLIAPYLAGLAAIGGQTAAVAYRDGRPWISVAVFAGALGLANFLHNARRQLDQSRRALREARAIARAGEQAADAANAAKSAFLATMSHEIRTPLNGVLGMAQAMQADELSETQRGRIAVVRESGETLLAILNDILDLSKIEAGRLTLETAEFDMGELARGAHAVFGAIAEERGLAFSLQVDEAARGVYRGDPTRVRQILHNLASNALKFTARGEVSVSLAALDPGVRIEVRDTGEGIAPEVLGKLFTKFVQADASTTRRFGGTGLGLAICRELTQMMGGVIRAESAPGLGSTFTVDLPLVRVGDAAAPAGRGADADQPFMDVSRLRVLAAEDNATNQLVLKTLLAQVGIEPVMVENGKLAVEAWEMGGFDLVLMDMQMPVMDGLTATRIIRDAEAAQGRPRTQIVALSANVLAHQVEEYRGAGMDGHIAKPIEVGRLFEVVQQASTRVAEKPRRGRRADRGVA
ncbi:MAG TPA: ATP-binding protein [Caulobacteraceae bacterium]|nr:ATP-binding protein [Caulobacteraceae bacterium]